MKKYILFFLLLIIPFKVYASYTSKYYVDVTVNEDGSLTFKEMISFDGSYNYFERRLYLKGNYKQFTGNSPSDFYGTDIYNASEITNICASSVPKEITDFDYVDNHNYCFDLTTNGYKGQKNKYTYDDTTSNKIIRIYNPSSQNENFYLEYTIKDAVVIHNDVAELLYNFEWSEDILDYQVYLHLPNDSTTFRIYSHGPMQGENSLIDKKTAYAYWKDLEANAKTDIRIIFDKSLVPNGNKKSNVDALDKIVSYETDLANTQNELRENLKQDLIRNAVYYTEYAEQHPTRSSYNNAYNYVELLEETTLKQELLERLEKVLDKVSRQEKIVRTINLTIISIWFLGLIYLLYKFYKYHDKEYANNLPSEYYRDLPNAYGPEILGYLLTRSNIKSDYLSASIMELIRKKSLKIDNDYSDKKKFKIIDLKNEEVDKDLTSSEILLKKWFINDVGNGEYVTNDDIKKASKNDYEDFLSNYSTWKNDVIARGKAMNFYENNTWNKTKYSLYCLLGILIYLLVIKIDNTSNYTLIYTLCLPISIISFIYIVFSTKKTKEGNDDYNKWMAFKKFLLDFGRFQEKELPEIYLWEHFLVYATAFGIADKVRKSMEMKIKEYNLDTSNTYIPVFYTNNVVIGDTIKNSITTGINKAQAEYNKAHSSSSSSGGFGGGASFGGGGGGFGGGGGRG